MSTAVISSVASEMNRFERSKTVESWTSTSLVETFAQRVFSTAKHITQNDRDAEDVLIGTFVEVCSDLEGCRKEELRHRLVTFAAREAFTKLRERHDGRLSFGPCDDVSENLVAREFSVWADDDRQRYSDEQPASVLENGLRSLAPMTRTIFVLRDIEQMSVEQIAAIVNRSVAAVEVCLLRARLQLRELLAPITEASERRYSNPRHKRASEQFAGGDV